MQAAAASCVVSARLAVPPRRAAYASAPPRTARAAWLCFSIKCSFPGFPFRLPHLSTNNVSGDERSYPSYSSHELPDQLCSIAFIWLHSLGRPAGLSVLLIKVVSHVCCPSNAQALKVWRHFKLTSTVFTLSHVLRSSPLRP